MLSGIMHRENAEKLLRAERFQHVAKNEIRNQTE